MIKAAKTQQNGTNRHYICTWNNPPEEAADALEKLMVRVKA